MYFFIICFSVLIIPFIIRKIVFRFRYALEKVKTDEMLKNREINSVEFYNKCVRKGIVDSEEEILAYAKEKGMNRYLTSNEKILEHFEQGKQFVEVNRALSNQKRQDYIKEQELNRKKHLEKYSKFQGREKRIQMLMPQYQQAKIKYLNSVENLNKLLDDKSLLQKEQEWAINCAYIQGNYDETDNINSAFEKIKSHKFKNDYISPDLLPVAIMVATKMVDECRRDFESAVFALDSATIASVSRESTEQVFKQLEIYDTQLKVTDSGTVKIKTLIRLKSPASINNIDAVVDGTICAVVYANNKKMGEALMSLPIDGISTSAVELKGYCVSTINKDFNYSVEFQPHNLWIIESISPDRIFH